MNLKLRYLLIRSAAFVAAWLMLLLTGSAPCQAYGPFTYFKGLRSVSIVRYSGESFGYVEIPREIEGLPVTSISRSAFSGAENVSRIWLPESIETVRPGAFDSSSSLEAIDVAPGNPVLSSADGILFNKAKTTLLACPGGKSGTVVIPDTVQVIDAEAFSYCRKLAAVVLPSGLRSIGSRSFSNCSGLTEIGFPAGMNTISSQAFYGCTGLTEVVIPAAPRVDGSAFGRCSGIREFVVAPQNTSVRSVSGVLYGNLSELLQYPGGRIGSFVIPESVTSIRSYAFAGCVELTAVDVPSTVSVINEYTFHDCPNLAQVTLPEGITQIGAAAFGQCTRLTDFGFPASLSSIDAGAFEGCVALREIQLPDQLLTIGTSAFSGCEGVEEMVIPPLVTTIGNSAFASCIRLASVALPGGLAVLNPGTFSGCNRLLNCTLPAGLKTIGDVAFSGCSRLNNIRIPLSLSSVAPTAFLGCSGLARFDVDPLNTVFQSNDGMLLDITGTKLLGVPGGAAGFVAVPAGITDVGHSSFRGCRQVTGVSLPEGVVTIGVSAFQDCTQLEAISLPSTLTAIVDGSFIGCSRLQEISIPAGVTTIGASTFSGCSGLSRVTLPPGLLSIRDYAFSGCRSLAGIALPEGLMNLQRGAFNGCEGLAVIVLPASLNISGNPFSGCTGVTEFVVSPGNAALVSLDGVLFSTGAEKLLNYPARKAGRYTIPATVRYIESSAFEGCAMLTGIDIPESVSSIPFRGFYGCSALREVSLPTGLTQIGYMAFAESGITSISIPQTTLDIDFGAFLACREMAGIEVDVLNPYYSSADGLLFDKAGMVLIFCPAGRSGEVALPEGLVSIHQRAFAGCAKVSGIILPDSLRFIASGSIFGCSLLQSLEIPRQLESIGYNNFTDCPLLMEFKVAGDNPFFSAEQGVLFDRPGTTLVRVPPTRSGVFRIPNGVESVGVEAFVSCGNLTRAIIPASVRSVGITSFHGCTQLTGIEVDAENPWFSSCEGVLFNKNRTELVRCPSGKAGVYAVPGGVEIIAARAFEHCSLLTELFMPGSLETLRELAFSSCSSLVSVFFAGNSPAAAREETIFSGTAPGYSSYFLSSRTGFSSPYWAGFPASRIDVAARPAAEWLLSHGFRHDADLLTDDDGDGVSLLEAYAFELDPRESLPARLPAPVLTPDGLELSFPGRRPGVSYRVETSTDLRTWTTDGIALSAPDADGLRHASVSRVDAARFLRLVLSQ